MQNKKEERPDNEVFAELQDHYLLTRDENTLTKMFYLIERYEYRTIRKYCIKNRIFKTKEIQHEEAHEMAVWFISQYLKRPDFKAGTMSAYGHNAFMKIMFDPRKKAADQFQKTLNLSTPHPEETTIDFSYEVNLWEKTDEPGVFQGLLNFFED